MPLRRPDVAVAVAGTSPLDGGTRIRTSCFRPIAAAAAVAAAGAATTNGLRKRWIL